LKYHALPVLELSHSRPGPASSSLSSGPRPLTPPFFFIQTECGRFIDSSVQQGLVLADYQSSGAQGQIFSMSFDGIITDLTTQLVLDGRDVTKGGSVMLMQPTGSPSQLWKINLDGSICLQNFALCLDVKGGQMRALAPLILWTPHGRSNQRFRIVSVFACLAPYPLQSCV
jgi:hypothetical protein